MANATYNKNYGGWVMTYTDRTKFRKDGKYLNRTKKEKDTAYPTLPARQKRLREAEMIAKAQAYEDACGKGKLSVKDPNAPILATDYLEQMETVTAYADNERAIADRKRIIKEFVEWLKGNKNFKKLYIHEITRLVTKEYISDLVKKDYASDTIKKRRKALSTVWGIIIEEFEDSGSSIIINNPFTDSKTLRRCLESADERAKKGKVLRVEKKALTIAQVREIMARMEYYQPILAKVWHLGFLTGWRVGDILKLKWNQVDYNNRTLTLISGKTKYETIIYLTDGLINLLNEVKAINPNTNPDDIIFSFKGMRDYYKLNRKVLNEMGLNVTATSGQLNNNLYTFHSLRGTIKTALKIKDFNTSRLNYLVGHKERGIDKHYNKFKDDPKGATADILDYLESVLMGDNNND